MKWRIKSNKYLKFILVIIVLSFILGIMFYLSQSSGVKENITNSLINIKSFKYNFIIIDLIMMSLLLVTSFFIIGSPLSFIYLGYNIFSFSFLLMSFDNAFGFKGIIYILLYFLINKFIVLIILILFNKRIINISRYIIGLLIYKNDNDIKNKVINNFIKCIYMILFVLIINIILYIVSPYIFKYFKFLIS